MAPIQKILEAEHQRRALQRATSIAEPQHRAPQRGMGIDEFCARYGPGRTTAYQEIKSGRLRARKCGKRTIIGEDDAESWLRCLPIVEPGASVGV